MKQLKIDYRKIEYGIIGLLSLLMLVIPVMHYICLKQGYTNDILAYFIYGTVLICAIAMIAIIYGLSNVTFKMGIYEWIFIVLLILEAFSVLNSVNTKTSIWGTGGRNEGILMLCSYYAIFYVARLLTSDRSKVILVNGFLGITLLHSIYGLCQYFGIATSFVFNSYPGMVSGVAGNPNFMGTLLVMASGLSAGMFYYSEKLYQKFSYLGLLVVYLFTLLLTKTMSAYFGVAVMILVFLGYLTITRNKHRQFANVKITSFKILMVALVGGISLLFIINIIMDNFIANELLDLVHQMTEMMETGQINESFGTGRFTIWSNVLQMVPHYLFTGVGIDALAEPYYYYFGLVNEQLIDKCHNEYLQILITMGLPALVCYLTFYFFVGKDLLKRLVEIVNHDREWNGEPLYVGLALAFIGYLAQAFFNISVIDVAPYFWILLGLMSESPIEVQKRVEMVSNQKKYIRLPNGQILEVKGTMKKNY